MGVFELRYGNLTLGDVAFGRVAIYGTALLNKMKILGPYLYGITGNVVFDKKILIISRKDNRFGVVD